MYIIMFDKEKILSKIKELVKTFNELDDVLNFLSKFITNPGTSYSYAPETSGNFFKILSMYFNDPNTSIDRKLELTKKLMEIEYLLLEFKHRIKFEIEETVRKYIEYCNSKYQDETMKEACRKDLEYIVKTRIGVVSEEIQHLIKNTH